MNFIIKCDFLKLKPIHKIFQSTCLHVFKVYLTLHITCMKKLMRPTKTDSMFLIFPSLMVSNLYRIIFQQEYLTNR